MADPEVVERYLTGARYPATKARLLELARSNGADPTVVNALKSIPDGEYEAAARVREALIDAGVDDFGDGEFESI